MPRFALLACLLFAPTLFAGPTADVMRLVPPKTSVCFVVQDLKGTTARVSESPFVQLFARSALGRSLTGSDEWKQLAAVETVLSDNLGVTFSDLRDQVFGDAVVYAYQMSADAGVVIGKAPKPDVLKRLTAKLNAAQVASTELKGTADKTHTGVGYVERTKADGRTEYYLLRDDGVFAYAGDEGLLKQVIARIAGEDKSAAPLAGAVEKLGLTEAIAAVLIDPTAFAADLAAQEKQANDANQKAFLRQFGKLWSAADAVGVSLTLNENATLAVTLATDPIKVPEELRSLVNPDSQPSAIWGSVPSDALLTVGGRFEWEKFRTLLGSFLGDDGKAGLKSFPDDTLGPLVGKDVLPKVLAGLGSDWGLWVTAPAKGDASPLPVATLAVRVRPAGGTDDAIGQAVMGAVDGVMHAVRIEHNRKHPADDQFHLTEDRTDGGTMKVLRNDRSLPAGVRPTYGLRGDFFVLATTSEAMKRFAPPKADSPVKPAPLVRLNAGKLAEYLTVRGGDLAGVLTAWGGDKPDKVKSDLADFAAVLELFETLELHHTGDGKKMSLSVVAKPAKPLRK
ncbi:MAG: hypothetical protein MUF18_03365 [Fimbriiglobus sp.]|jgi:hypothetical protein|nr:hypothetical protein [Fimbriiglobus sp.]